MLNRTWFVTPDPRPYATVRVICLPYAGGGAAPFRQWARQFSYRIEFSVLQLPGRENRAGEPFLRDMAEVVRAVGPCLARASDKPFVLFGHSVGALMAYELTQWLHHLGERGPAHLIVAGKRAPHLPLPREPLHELNDERLIAKLRQLNGTPQSVLDSRELMELLLPRLRADFAINETYRYAAAEPLACPMTVFGGVDDPETSLDALEAWRLHSKGPFEQRLFNGDHFFVHSLEAEVLGEIQRLALAAAGVVRPMPLAATP